jgi:ATP-dependent RNA helicase DeaD
VLDEADEMLRMGFIEDVEWIMEQTPPGRQVALFSATLPPAVRRIAQRHLQDPVEITIKVLTTTPDTIHHRYWMVSGVQKLEALTRILESEPFDGIIVFVRTKTAAVELAERLEARGYSTAPLNSDISQRMRERTIEQLKSGKLDILVATDVAARGLDVDRISHVINYDIPYDPESYVHRVGRTGRAGRTGEAILFVAPRERRMLSAIEKATRHKIAMMTLPSAALINDRRVARFKQRITEALATGGIELFAGIVEQYSREHNVSVQDIAAALAKLAQGTTPLLLPDRPAPVAVHAGDAQKRVPRLFSRDRSEGPPAKGTERFRLEVGHRHGVKPGNIVGALINEAGLDSNHIGHIVINDAYSTVDLPEGMPRDVFRTLKKVWVAGQQLRISRMEEREKEPVRPGHREGKPRSEKRPDKPGHASHKKRAKR